MEEERKRGKEYYQVNLDMGRLFWIAFLLGLFIIGIFIVGFWVGGGRGEKEGKELFKLGRTELFKRERVGVPVEDETIKFRELFENNLETETRYIDVKSLEEVAEGKIQEQVALPQQEQPVKVVSVPEKLYIPPKTKPTTSQPRPYVAKGDYYIQVASFVQKENAQSMTRQLQKSLYRVVIEEAVVNNQTYYRVRVGPFESKSIAANTMVAMKRRFDLESPFVLKKES